MISAMANCCHHVKRTKAQEADTEVHLCAAGRGARSDCAGQKRRVTRCLVVTLRYCTPHHIGYRGWFSVARTCYKRCLHSCHAPERCHYTPTHTHEGPTTSRVISTPSYEFYACDPYECEGQHATPQAATTRYAIGIVTTTSGDKKFREWRVELEEL